MPQMQRGLCHAENLVFKKALKNEEQYEDLKF